MNLPPEVKDIFRKNHEVLFKYFSDKYAEKIAPKGIPEGYDWALKRSYQDGQAYVYKTLCKLVNNSKEEG